MPIDYEEIARTLQVHPDIVFGRLHYHLEPKYGYAIRPDDQYKRVAFFALSIGEKDRHFVNLPLLAAVLAGMQEEGDRYLRTAIIASVSSFDRRSGRLPDGVESYVLPEHSISSTGDTDGPDGRDRSP